KQALTFMVFREQPTPEWTESVQARPVPLDPDRLAPLEATPDQIDILIGLPPDGQVPTLGEHPLTKALEVASDHHLVVLDAQHPVPAPSAARVNWRWSRMRVGLRGGDIPRLADFLSAICDLAAGNAAWDLRVQMTALCAPQSLNPVEQGERVFAASRVVLDSDMDAVTKASGRSEERRVGKEWRGWRWVDK